MADENLGTRKELKERIFTKSLLVEILGGILALTLVVSLNLFPNDSKQDTQGELGEIKEANKLVIIAKINEETSVPGFDLLARVTPSISEVPESDSVPERVDLDILNRSSRRVIMRALAIKSVGEKMRYSTAYPPCEYSIETTASSLPPGSGSIAIILEYRPRQNWSTSSFQDCFR